MKTTRRLLKWTWRNLRKGSKIIIGFDARARHDIKETRAVLNLGGSTHVFGLDSYLKKE